MRLRLLGPVEVVEDEGHPVVLGGPKERRVLAALAVHLDQPVSEARLFDALWGDEPPATATKTLQAYVSRLRKALGGSDDLRIESVESGYVLRCAPGVVDTAHVEALVADARAAEAAGRLDVAAEGLRAAEACWRGPAFGDLATEPFALAEASRLEDLRLSLMEERVQVDLARGRHAELVSDLEALTARFPLRERLWGARMLALYRSGRQADALRAFQDLRRLLGEELGIDPSPELRALEEAVLLQSSSLDWEAPAPVATAGSVELPHGLPSGVVTFLLTDVEGSTRMWDSAPRAMDAALRRHDAIITSAVESNGGRLLKSRGEGDSSFSVFARASQAAAAALAAQAALAAEGWPDGAPIRVRMAIHMGEAAERDHDYFGPAVNRVARLRALAAGGEVLVSRSAAEVLTDHVGEEFHLVELGERTLRDLARPEHVFALAPARGAEAAPHIGDKAGASRQAARSSPYGLALPPHLASQPSTGVVGRVRERERLFAAFERVMAMEGHRVVLLSGEPGIGKTTLARDLAQRAHDGGATVLYGRCDDELGLPYQPIVEALGAFVSGADDAALLELDPRQLSELSRLLPQVRDRLPTLAGPPTTDADAERYLMFGAISSLLVAMAVPSPVVLVLDDLQWADKPTVLLLRHLVHTLDGARVMLVGTYRETDLTGTHPLTEGLAALWREPSVDRIEVGGLDDSDVVVLLERSGGHPPDAGAIDLAHAVGQETGGNPFFTAEVIRHLLETGAVTENHGRLVATAELSSIELPASVREVISQRVRRLGDGPQQVLAIAAVMGRSFDLAPLAQLVGLDEDAVLNAVEEAARAAILTEVDGRYARFAFTHALIQHTLYEELSASRRSRAHRRLAELIEAECGVDPGDRIGELAHHWIAGSTEADVGKAAGYARSAGERALGALAPDEAIRWFREAIELIDSQSSPTDPLVRLDVLRGLGDAQRQAGDPGYRETLLVAAAEAARLGDRERMVAAALANHRGTVSSTGAIDVERIAALERALVAVDDGDSQSRAWLLAALAAELTFTGDLPRVRELAAEAEAMARRLGDDATLLRVLNLTFQPLWVPEDLARSVAASEEALALADRVGDPVARFWAGYYRVFAMACGADRAAIDAGLELVTSLAEQIGQPFLTGRALQLRGSLALLSGQVAEAERLAGEALQIASDTGQPDALMVFGANLAVIRMHQGRAEELLPALEAGMEDGRLHPVNQAGYAMLLCESGRDGEAAALLQAARETDFNQASYDFLWLTTMTLWADVAASVGDESAAGVLYDRLAPFDAQGVYSGATFTGTVGAYLARLAVVLERHDEARAHFQRANDQLRALRAPFWHARNQVEWARLLMSIGGEADLRAARELLAEASETASAYGCAGIQRRAEELATVPRLPLPRALARDDLCVGREEPLTRLETLWEKAQDGFRQAALIAGEPGIGKTTLAAALARQVHDSGGLVLYGRCDEDLGVAFQPFAEALRSLVAGVADELLLGLGHHAMHLTRLLPDLAERLPDLAKPIPADAEAERFTLFEAVVSLVARVGRDTPVLLVLDDLHWAAKPTLLMLRHLLRADGAMRLMVVGTYRDTEIDRSHALGEVLADLRREAGMERLDLAGLDRAGVQALVSSTAGQDLDDSALDLSDAVHQQTNGNPFFVVEVLRNLAESGAIYQGADGRWVSDLAVDDIGLPAGIRDVVGRRLSRLSPAANQALSVAAVVGPTFELRLLEAIPETGERSAVLDALDEAVTAGLLSEDRGTYAFPHALVRQTLLDELTSTRRLRLHQRIGDALESIASEGVEALAFHFAEGASVEPEAAAKACDYALAAAHSARTRAAYEEAITHLERGLEAVEFTLPLDRERRCDLLLELGELHRWLSSRPAAATDLGVRAAADARAIGSTERLARAAAQAMQIFVGTPDVIGVALVEEALALLPKDDLERRITLLLLLAAHRTEAEGRREEGAKLSTEAFALAREAPAGMAEAVSSAWVWGTVDEIEEVVRWLSRVPPERQTAQQLTLLAQARAITAFEVGDVAAVDAAVLQLQELAEETHGWSATYIWIAYSITRALMDGRWDDAEASLSALASHAGENVNALNVWAGNQFVLLRDRGELETLLPVIESASESNPGIPAFRAGHAVLLAEQGRAEMASRVLAPLAGAAISSMPHDEALPVTLAMVAEGSARLRDVESCELAHLSMSGFGGRLATVSGAIAVGATDRYLGMLTATLGRLDDAERHYEAAIDLEGRLGARPWLVRTRTWYARMLLERSRPGDADKAKAMLATALVDADDLGMSVVAAEIRGLLRPPLPRALARDDLCVGREEPLTRLETLWEKAQDGFRQAALIAGEPGIGKTTLAATFARQVHKSGGLVLYGRCDEDLGVPFQPFAEALRSLVVGVPDEQLRALGHHASHLTRLLPEIAERLPDLAPPIPADAEAERFSLFEAVVELMSRVAVDAPILLVLDDLHWAAKPTLLLLRHVLRAEAGLRLLVVGTYRDTEVDRSHAFAEVLADLRREAGVARLALAGLDRAAVQELVAATAGQDLDGQALELSDTLHHQTSGNPFFVGEVLRHLAESGAVYQDAEGRWTSDLAVDDLGLPEGVRDVVGRRLSRLSPAANVALTVGAVSGAVFDLRLLESVPEAGDPTSVLDSLEEGVAAGLLSEDRGTYAFPHALVRQTLLEELSSTRRLRLHRSIGFALESLAPDEVEALAFHFAEAASVDPECAAKACDHALGAADRARSRSAYEEAIAHLERGLEAVELTRPIDRERRCDLLLELGELQRRLLGRSAEFRRRGVQAADDARALGSSHRLARAAIVAMYPEVGTPDPIGVALVEEALVAVDEDDLAVRIPLLSLLASHRTESEGRRDEGDALRAEVRQLARRVPPEVAATAIIGSWRFNASGELDFIVDILSALPAEMLTAEQLSLMAQVKAASAFDSGDLQELDLRLDDLRRLADETHGWDPVYMSAAFSVTRALLDGRWGDAETSLATLVEHAGDTVNALNVWAANQVLLLRDQGRHEEILPIVESAAESNPGIPAFRAGQALLLAELGRLDDARQTFAPVAGEAVASTPRDQVFSVTLAMIAEVAARTGDTESSRRAHAELLPFSGKLASVIGTVVVGAVDRYLGMLEATLGRLDEAEGHYRAAIDLEERLGSRPYLARTRTWYARMLIERGASGDLDEARVHLAKALVDAQDLGMTILAAEIWELLRPPLPATLAVEEGAFFVGRARELDVLDTAWRAAVSGERRCVLLAGEPGVGKSRLAAEVALRAYDDGALVLFGRCDEGVGMPFQPFVEALRHRLATASSELLAAQLADRGGELTRLFPELSSRFPDLPAPTRAEPEAERYFLFEAVTDLLVKSAEDQPVVLVLDDLQWATLPTLLLLRHLLRAEVPARVLVIGTYRDTELDAGHPLPGVVAELRRTPGVVRHRLTGLDRAEVSAFLTAAAGHDLDERSHALADALAAETNGNPLFITEVLAHLVETGGLAQADDGRWQAAADMTVDHLGLPAGVTEVVTSRLDRLDGDVRDVLIVAAVVGQEIDIAVVEGVLQHDVLDAVDAATAAGLLVERSPGRYGFVHAIVRQTLISTLSATRRARLHRQVGEAIEALARPEAHLDDLAYHFAEAAADGQAAKAADYALAAGRAAFERAASEEADRIFLRGLAALDLEQPVDRLRRVDLLCAIAEMHLVTERFGAYHPMSAVAVEEARALGDPERFARAVGIRCRLLTVADDYERVALCEEALAQISDDHPALRASLLAGMAIYYVMVGSDVERAATLAEEALDLARFEDEALPLCLETRILTLLGSPEVEVRLALVDELIGIRAAGDVYRHRAVACLMLGDIDGFDAAAAVVAVRAEETDDDFNRMFAASNRCLRALMTGDFEAASAHLDEVLRWGDLADPNTLAVYSASYWTLQRERGDLEALVPMLADVLAQNPTVQAFRPLAAHTYAAVGMLDEARRMIDDLARDRFSGLATDYAWPVALALLIEAAARLDAPEWAAQLESLLRPHSGHLVATGWGVVCIGAADRYLGMASTMAGDYDEAEARFIAALELEERVEATALVARTRYWFAEMLRRRGAPGDAERAQALVAEALADAEALGMPVLASELRDLLA